MFIFLTVVQALVAAALVVVILVQKSDGGGLGSMGGSPTGFMSARGAADFITRATQVLAGLFILLSILLAGLAVKMGSAQTVDTSLNRSVPAAPAPVDSTPAAGQPAAGPAAPASSASSAQGAPSGSLDPLAGVLKK